MAKYKFPDRAPVIRDPAARDLEASDKNIARGFRDLDSSLRSSRRSGARTRSGRVTTKSFKPVATLKAQKQAKSMNFFNGRG